MFAGQSGVFAFTMAGKPVWKARRWVAGCHQWGSGTSVVLHQDLVIVNASVESGAIVALNKTDGKEAWRFEGIEMSWSTPVVATAAGGRSELIVSMKGKVLGLAPESGREVVGVCRRAGLRVPVGCRPRRNRLRHGRPEGVLHGGAAWRQRRRARVPRSLAEFQDSEGRHAAGSRRPALLD